MYGYSLGYNVASLGSKLRILDFATADGSKTVNIILQFPATESITVLWGDGTETTRSGNGIIDVVFSKTYAGAGSYPIKMEGAWRETTYFSVNDSALSGDLGKFPIHELTNLSNFSLYNNSFTGDLSGWDISGLTNLSSFSLYNNSFTGKLPNARAVIYRSYTNKFSDSNQTAFKVNMTEMNIRNQGVAFSTANIDKLLKAIADWYQVNAPTSNCTFDMSGANMGIPTGGASNADITRLVGYYTAAGRTATVIVRTS